MNAHILMVSLGPAAFIGFAYLVAYVFGILFHCLMICLTCGTTGVQFTVPLHPLSLEDAQKVKQEIFVVVPLSSKPHRIYEVAVAFLDTVFDILTLRLFYRTGHRFFFLALLTIMVWSAVNQAELGITVLGAEIKKSFRT